MPSQTLLIDLHGPRHPMRYKPYSIMFDKLHGMAYRFDQLGYRDIADCLESARHELYKAWDLVQMYERAQRALYPDDEAP